MASLPPSLVLRIPRAALARRDAVDRLSATWQGRSLFAFKCDELAFARALLDRRTNAVIGDAGAVLEYLA